MNLNAKFILLFCIISLLTACTSTEEQRQPASASSAFSSELPPSRWSSTSVFPLNLRPSADFTSDEITSIGQAGVSWSTAVNNKQTFFDTSNSLNDSSKSSLSDYQDGTYGIYKVFSWPSDLPDTALAVTQIFGLRRNIGESSEYIQITHADILVNYDHFSFSTDDSYGYDLETVMLHEMGHFIGLYHDQSSLSQSVMYPTVSKYVDNRTPMQNDINALSSKYLISTSSSLQIGAMRSSSLSSEESSEDEITEPVEIIFEMHANGEETIKFNRKEISHKNCNHNHSTTTFEK